MFPLVTVAQLVMLQKSPCLHAVIIFSDGSESEELFSEADAFECILNALKDKRIYSVEADYLREEVRKLPLPFETPEGTSEAFCEHKPLKNCPKYC